MLTLDTLNVMLAVSEEGLIEEVVITLLASPQLAAFFEKFPKLRKAMTDDLPRWRDNLRQRFKETEVPPELTEEVAGYQQCQRLSTPQFIAQLQQTLTLLDNVHSPVCQPGQSAGHGQPQLHFRPAYAVFTALATEPCGPGHGPQSAVAGRRARTVAQ